MASAAPLSEPANDGNLREESTSPALRLDERNSLELVIAFTGPVGSGVSTVCDMLTGRLTDDFDYEPFYIKVSGLIKEHAAAVGVNLNQQLTPTERVDEYQSAGNKLREKKPTYLADRVIERINALRRENKGVLEQANAPDIPVQRRFAYIIDSLKNPAEVNRLRQIYGDLFWHVTVFAPD